MATDDTRTSASDAYEIIKAQPNTPDVIEVDGKPMQFRDNGMMRVKDRGLAMDIRNKYGAGKQPGVTVTRVNYPSAHDRGHKYFFSVPELPWRRQQPTP